jgi:hypothetical protein
VGAESLCGAIIGEFGAAFGVLVVVDDHRVEVGGVVCELGQCVDLLATVGESEDDGLDRVSAAFLVVVGDLGDVVPVDREGPERAAALDAAGAQGQGCRS